MPDDAAMIATWERMLDAFGQGDMTTFASSLADDFNGMMNDIAMTRDQFVLAVSEGRSRGWIGQHVLSISARANVLTVHYRNSFNDGSTTEGGGVALFGDDGRIVAIRALTAQARAIQPLNT